jgi:hypothetical protein
VGDWENWPHSPRTDIVAPENPTMARLHACTPVRRPVPGPAFRSRDKATELLRLWFPAQAWCRSPHRTTHKKCDADANPEGIRPTEVRPIVDRHRNAHEGETHHGARFEKSPRRSGAMGWRGTVSVLVPPRAVNTAGPSHTSTRNNCYSPAAGRSMSAGSSPVDQCRDWCWAKCSSCCCNGCLAQSDGVVERRCHHVACSHLQRRFGQTHLGRTIETEILRKKRVS